MGVYQHSEASEKEQGGYDSDARAHRHLTSVAGRLYGRITRSTMLLNKEIFVPRDPAWEYYSASYPQSATHGVEPATKRKVTTETRQPSLATFQTLSFVRIASTLFTISLAASDLSVLGNVLDDTGTYDFLQRGLTWSQHSSMTGPAERRGG